MGSVLTNEKRWKNELFLEELQTEKEEDGSIKYFTNRKTIINLMSKYSLNSTDEYDYKYRMLKIDLDNWFYSYGGEMGFVEKDVLRISKELDRDLMNNNNSIEILNNLIFSLEDVIPNPSDEDREWWKRCFRDTSNPNDDGEIVSYYEGDMRDWVIGKLRKEREMSLIKDDMKDEKVMN